MKELRELISLLWMLLNLLFPSPTPPPGYAVVTKVVDGDTIKISTGQTVRYIGIDTPETVDPRRPAGCFGKEASAKNSELVLGKTIRMEKDVSETDKFGRLLRYVYVDDQFVNETLVKEGYAYAASFPPDISKQDVFTAAQREAKTSKVGLWNKCPTTP
jgi:micrococcal nuclease